MPPLDGSGDWITTGRGLHENAAGRHQVPGFRAREMSIETVAAPGRFLRDPAQPRERRVRENPHRGARNPHRFDALQAHDFTLLRLIIGPLEGRHVELHHRHHGFHHGLDLPGVTVADQLHESPWDDLPRDPERILDPAALGRRGAGLDELVPILVDFLLVLAVDIEREAFGEGEVRAPL